MKGKITISRVQCSHEDDYVGIQITDEISGTRFVQIKLDLKAFANAITGFAMQSCEFETNKLERIGTKREHKVEFVPRPKLQQEAKAAKKELDIILSHLEVDGWEATRGDAYNHHRWSGDEMVSVGFIRYVDDA